MKLAETVLITNTHKDTDQFLSRSDKQIKQMHLHMCEIPARDCSSFQLVLVESIDEIERGFLKY